MTVIAIDVGHGGKDSGAVSKSTGMQEKKINLNVGLKLKELLIRDGFEVVITRETDIYLTFPQRGKIANDAKADLMICIHHNAGGGHGYDLIHNLNKELSYRACLGIAKEFDRLGQTKHRIFNREGEKGKDYYGIMRATNCPVVITEYAFLDTDDVKDVDTLTEQWAEAQAIANALKVLFGKQEEVCPTCKRPL